MKTILLAILTACLTGMPALHAQTVENDIVYGNKARNQMDLYLPDVADKPPVVIFIHGGRWFRNDKKQVQLYDRVARLTEAGIAVATINHTYSTETLWPAQKHDVIAALSYLTENGSELGIDPSRMAVWGQSSGAHLALWAGLLSAQDDGLNIDAIVSWYAPSNLFELRADREADDVPGGNERFTEPSPESLLIGVPVPENRDAADAASPEHQANSLPPEAKLPPILLMHGDADSVVSPLQSKRLYDTLRARDPDAEVELRIVEGGGHGGDAFEPVVPEVVSFLNRHLRPVKTD